MADGREGNGAAPRAPLVRPWRGRSPAQRQADRRALLLDAALEVFGTSGFRTATVVAICAEAGLTNRYFYEHFADREAALRVVYDEVVAEAFRVLRAALDAAPLDVVARVRAGLTAYWAYETADPRRPRVQTVEIVGVSEALEQHRRSVVHAFADLIAGEHARLAAAGLLPPRPFRRRAVALVGAVNELLIDWALGVDRPPTAEVVDELAELFLVAFDPPRSWAAPRVVGPSGQAPPAAAPPGAAGPR